MFALVNQKFPLSFLHKSKKTSPKGILNPIKKLLKKLINLSFPLSYKNESAVENSVSIKWYLRTLNNKETLQMLHHKYI